MKQILVIAFLMFSVTTFSQSVDLPRNPKAGKCYIKCTLENFDYTKKYKGSTWKEVECDSRHKIKKENLNYLNSTKGCNDYIKLKKYKEKLVSLGYKLDVNCFMDYSFIKAHNKYIRKKKREERKRKKNKTE